MSVKQEEETDDFALADAREGKKWVLWKTNDHFWKTNRKD